MKRLWAVSLHSSYFADGVAWVSHAKRYKLTPVVADIGLTSEQVKQLVAADVVVLPTGLKSHFEVWLDVLNAEPDFGVLLYTSPANLFDPTETIRNGEDHMVFARWPANSEYYNLCDSIHSIVARARAANYIESKVGEKHGAIASPATVCGPAYFWRAMMGATRLVRAGQQYPSNKWEPMAVNLFAAIYPEYTFIEEEK